MADNSGIETAMDTDLFRRDVDDYANAMSRIQNNYKEYQREIEALKRIFSGKGAEVFFKRFQSEDIQTEDLIKDLDEMRDGLQYALKEYVKCENEVAGIINAIKV